MVYSDRGYWGRLIGILVVVGILVGGGWYAVQKGVFSTLQTSVTSTGGNAGTGTFQTDVQRHLSNYALNPRNHMTDLRHGTVKALLRTLTREF